MKKSIFLLPAMVILTAATCMGQNVGINSNGTTPDASAMLDVDVSALAAKRGLLIPRVALTSSIDAATILSPATSLLVYNLGTGGLSPAGYYYNSGTSGSPVWVQLLNGGAPGTAWLLAGNAGTTPGTHFLGTTDAQDLVFKTAGTEWMRILLTGNVGIGTINPLGKLHIAGGYATSGMTGTGSFYMNGTSASPNSGQLVWGDNTGWKFHFGTVSAGNFVERMTLVDQGNVGIGTTSPQALLHLHSTNNGAAVVPLLRLRTAGANANNGPAIDYYIQDNGATETLAGRIAALLTNGGAGTLAADMTFSTTTGSASSEKMRIMGNGNVGIGTTAPAVRLQVVGSIWATGAASSPGIYMNGTITGAAGTCYGILSRGTIAAGANNDLLLPIASNQGTASTGTFTGLTFSAGYFDAATWAKSGTGTINNGYGLYVTAPSIATSNYAAAFMGGNVGIGTSAPTNPVHLVTSTNSNGYFHTDGTINLSTWVGNVIGLGNAGWFGTETAHPLVLATQGGSNIVLLTNGNVGIGTMAPNTRLDARGAMWSPNSGYKGVGALYSTDAFGTSVGAGLLMGGVYTGTTVTEFAQIAGIKENATDADNAGALTLYTRANASATMSERMRISSAGLVGIGTNQATEKLQVKNGNVYVMNSGALQSVMIKNDGGIELFRSAAGIVPYVNGYLDFKDVETDDFDARIHWDNTFQALNIETTTDGTPATTQSRMVILNATGNVGIGTTAPAEKLEVCGNVIAIGTITAQGAITTNAGLACSSDIRYKKNIRTLQNALDNVLSLHGVNYDWRVSEFPQKNFSENTQTGFIAQELEKIFPEMVFTDSQGYKSVDYSRLTPVLVEAIKEQQKIIDKQNADIETLKAENQQMKTSNLIMGSDINELKADMKILMKQNNTAAKK